MLCLAFLLLTVAAQAQEARLSGSVTDPIGAALANVEVTITQTARNITFKTTTAADGRYRFPQLPIGTHQVKAEAPGFKTFVQSDVVLTTNAEALLNIVMQLGEVKEQVTVSAEASRVNTESSTLQQLVDSRRILDMPLIGRDVYGLAALVPGTGPSGLNIGGGRSGGQSSSGQNVTMINVRLDGALNVDQGFGYLLPSPSPDSVQEFTTQTSMMSARYSHSAGAIEISTKSGTNDIHGTVYEFLRNSALDARTFFQATKLKRRRNQYGASAGGPVYLPKLYNGRNRTFWFLDFQQLKEPLTSDAVTYVPTAQQIAGDFSLISANVRDPQTGQPFPGKQIPTSRLDPLALNLVKKYVPSAQDASGTLRYQAPADSNSTQILGRADQVLGGGRHQISGRVFVTRKTAKLAAGSLPVFSNGDKANDSDNTGLTYTANLSPTKINVVRFSINRYYQALVPDTKISLDDLHALGWASNYYTYTSNMPEIVISGFFSISNQYPSLIYNTHTTTFSDEFSWVTSRHNIQMGFQGIRAQQSDTNFARTNGTYTINGSFSGSALGDFFLGRPYTFRQGSQAPDSPRNLDLAWYFQDDIKVNRRLMLNLGLRHELIFPTVSNNNAMIRYEPGAKSAVYANAPTGLLFYGDPGVTRGGRDMRRTDFGPRIGVAYALTSDQKTMLRIGYGLYFAPPITNIDGQFAIYQPFCRDVTISVPASTSNPWANWAGGNPHPYTPSKNSVFDQQITGIAYGPNFKDTGMHQWNFSLQREVAKDWLATAAYVGSRSTHIPYLRDMNAAIYIPGSSTTSNVNQRRPLYPYFARFSSIESVTNSNYNSLQASLDKRFAKGFSLLMSYTFSKTLTELNSLFTNDGGVQNPDNRRLEWGPADFDRTHAFTTSWVWHVPSGRFRRGAAGAVLGGWQLNGITYIYSGAALAISASQDRALRGQPNRPDRLRDASLSTDRSRAERILRYFDTTAYAVNASGQFGTTPRADSRLRGPGSVNMILGALKDFRGLLEPHRLQFRAEASNALNRPNFGNPGTNIDSASSFGRITSASDGRIIQLGLKYIF